MVKSEFNEFLVLQLSSIRDDIALGIYDELFDNAIQEIISTSNSGQSEYALSQDAFDNFNRLGNQLELAREKVLWVYAQKHMDGIVSYLKGHRSQREPVQGRIKDVIVYMILLWAMTNENDSNFTLGDIYNSDNI